jgi:hypothetical protein
MGKQQNQIDHILIDKMWHSNIIDIQSFRWANCDIDHYLVVAKVKQSLLVSKWAA